ncbi:protein SON [Drosophila madeirensis]|uniref:Protein SON n=1 Tax=Drosophila madeirensis TaxID=30013 RepID=A0AAU9FHP1_DROMD
MPVNLRKKAIREARNRNEKILSNRKRKKRKSKAWITARRQCNAAERAEHNDLVDSTEQELRQILDDFGELSDIPYDCTATELLGEIAIAEGNATTIYVERDGLSTLTIVLHQPVPTIAQLKKAIAVISRAEHKRRQRERHEESLRRRGLAEDGGHEDRQQQQRQRQQQVAVGAMPCSTGELVYSALRNGHDHRAFVSWRFLWRCFGLFNVETNQPIDDRSNGRATLKELGIENAATLKFVHRVKYFGCQRQR